MDVQELIARENTLSRLVERENTVSRLVEREQRLSRMAQREENLWRQHEHVRGLVETERRHAAMWHTQEHLRILNLINPRPPFENTLLKMAEESHGFERLTAHLTKSSMRNSALESPAVGESFRRLAEPFAELKKAFEPVAGLNFRSGAFDVTDAMRLVKPFEDLERRLDFLRDHSFSEIAHARSAVLDTISGISNVLDAVRRPLPPMRETLSLDEVVGFVGSRFAETAEPTAWQEIAERLIEIQEELRTLKKPGLRENIEFAAAVVSLLLALVSLWMQFTQNTSGRSEKNPTPPALQEKQSTPSANSDTYSHTCP